MARASLEELKLDYEDYLRQHGLKLWDRENPLRQELNDKRCQTDDELASWVVGVAKRDGLSGQNGCSGQNSLMSTKSTGSILSRNFPELSANAVLVLIIVANSLMDRQVGRLARDFEKEGGFTERLFRVRSEKRRKTF